MPVVGRGRGRLDNCYTPLWRGRPAETVGKIMSKANILFFPLPRLNQSPSPPTRLGRVPGSVPATSSFLPAILVPGNGYAHSTHRLVGESAKMPFVSSIMRLHLLRLGPCSQAGVPARGYGRVDTASEDFCKPNFLLFRTLSLHGASSWPWRRRPGSSHSAEFTDADDRTRSKNWPANKATCRKTTATVASGNQIGGHCRWRTDHLIDSDGKPIRHS